jgi:hypothetical protein
MAKVNSEIKKALVRLKDPTGSFTDIDGQFISGEGVHEVELSGMVLSCIVGGALIQLGNLEEKAYYAEKEAKEAEEKEAEKGDDTEGSSEKEKKGKKA